MPQLLLVLLWFCFTTASAVSPYALYSLPPFTVTFTSSYTTAGLPKDLGERGQLLASTLHAPLQLITAEFLLGSFRMEIAKHAPASSSVIHQYAHKGNATATTQPPFQDGQEETVSVEAMLDSFMTLDLQVAVRSMNNKEENGGRRRRQLEEYPVLTFQADFFTTAAFLEPATDNLNVRTFDSSSTSNNNDNDNESNTNTASSGKRPPSNDAVALLFEEWMEAAFVRDKEYYFDSLVDSDEGVLKHMEKLDIQTNSDATFDPYAMGTLHQQEGYPGSNNQAATSGGKESAQSPNNAAAAAPSSKPSMDHVEKLFLTLLIFVSVASFAGLLFAIKQYRRRRRYKMDHIMDLENCFGPGGIDEFSDHIMLDNGRGVTHRRHSLEGRHADEVMEILNASDRYLAAHRPDLLAAMKEREQNEFRRSDGSSLIPVATNSDTNRPAERRYVTPTNPFSYLYGASYFHSDRRAVEADRRKHVTRSAMDGVERESVPDDEDLDLVSNASTARVADQTVSARMQDWFVNLVKRRSATTLPQEEEYDDDEVIVDDLDTVEEGGVDNQGTDGTGSMACDEDPSQYNFAYQDFPRQDGTPCLIYEETLDEEEEEQFLRNSQRDSLHSTTRYGDTLTDDEFQQALTQHALVDYQQTNSSFQRVISRDDSDNNGEDVSSYVTGDDESQSDSIISTSTDSVLSGFSETEPANFTDKLERLVAMRHRHYEKQKIVDKHREQRRQERARQRTEERKKQQVEMEERDRRLRRHSLELDIQELEAATAGNNSSTAPTPTKSTIKHYSTVAPSTASKVITPTDRLDGGGHQQHTPSNAHQVQKPNLHRRTSSEADKKGFASAGASAPIVGVQMSRSAGLGEERVFDGRALPPSSSASVGKNSFPKLSAPSGRNTTSLDDIFRRPTSDNGTAAVPTSSFPPASLEKTDTYPNVISPASSNLTDTGSTTTPSSAASHSSSRSTPPLNSMGSGSIRDGTSARRKNMPEMSSASLALAKGFHSRRSMSFGGAEEKKAEEEITRGGGSSKTGGVDADRRPLNPRRTSSFNRPRSGSGADVMVHGIYAHFM